VGQVFALGKIARRRPDMAAGAGVLIEGFAIGLGFSPDR
jgi:hypothetical protein